MTLSPRSGSPFEAPDNRSAAIFLDETDVARAAQTDACVLLTGSGTAAETLAYRIHSLSGWRYGPFIAVDCGLPEALVERRLLEALGSGDDSLLEPQPRLSQDGTLYLQEVGRLSTRLQAWLADRLTGLRARRGHVHVRRRVLASSSEFLLPRVYEGTFNDHLFYRLNVIHVVLMEATSA